MNKIESSINLNGGNSHFRLFIAATSNYDLDYLIRNRTLIIIQEAKLSLKFTILSKKWIRFRHSRWDAHCWNFSIVSISKYFWKKKFLITMLIILFEWFFISFSKFWITPAEILILWRFAQQFIHSYNLYSETIHQLIRKPNEIFSCHRSFDDFLLRRNIPLCKFFKLYIRFHFLFSLNLKIFLFWMISIFSSIIFVNKVKKFDFIFLIILTSQYLQFNFRKISFANFIIFSF
jgi:hypothetical protein